MDYRFRVDFLEEAKEFLDGLNEKSRDKVIYNIWKSRSVNDKELFKKLQDEIWEFRTLHNKTYFRLLAFWDKEDKADTIVVATHGVVKKTGKMPKSEIDKAEKLRQKYFKDKRKKK
jgi:phage-related protein